MKTGLRPRSHRRTRYARLSALLALVVIASVILLNVLVSALAERFGWYLNMGKTQAYRLSDDCRAVLSDAIERADQERAQKGEQPLALRILFCQPEEDVEEDIYLQAIYQMALEIRDTFPDTVTVECLDTLRNPTSVERFRGEDRLVTIPNSSVILDIGERWSILTRESFYELSSADYATTMGFSGNSRYATAITTLASGRVKYACLTSSHGEAYEDYEVQHLLTDAGYVVATIDLRTEEVPEECTLLLTYAPKTDLLAREDVSDVSETDKIRAFLDRGGNYMVFLSPDTPVLPHLDALLSEWGIVGDSFTVTATDATSETYRYTVRNEGASVTAGGYTISAIRPTTDVGDRVLETLGDGRRVSFGNTTSFSPADGWTVREDGASWSNGTRTATTLFAAPDGSDAYAAGRRVESGRSFSLLAYATDAATGGGVTALGTPELLWGEVLQSPVLGNRQALLCLLHAYDGDVVLGIDYATWPSTRMESVTTRETRDLTILCTVLPAVLLLVTGTIVLQKRRRRSL